MDRTWQVLITNRIKYRRIHVQDTEGFYDGKNIGGFATDGTQRITDKVHIQKYLEQAKYGVEL